MDIGSFSLDSDALPRLKAITGLAQRVGNYAAQTQGGGGNLSLKLDERRLIIKASGIYLSQMQPESGWVLLDYANTAHAIAKLQNDTQYNALLKKQTLVRQPADARPSMEAGFHALLPGRVVLHTHSVYANFLCCSQEGQALCRELFDDCVWVGYATPGLQLMKAIAGHLRPDMPKTLWLENHGLVVHADSIEETETLNTTINHTIAQHFQLPDAEAQLQAASSATSIAADRILFPDQVIYSATAALAATLSGRQMAAASQYVETHIRKAGLTPRYLTGEAIKTLLNMESEKHRQKHA